jgi:hypothetical protein
MVNLKENNNSHIREREKEREQNQKIIGACNTCSMPIREGEVIWYSSTGQHSGYTSGTYAGDENMGAVAIMAGNTPLTAEHSVIGAISSD